MKNEPSTSPNGTWVQAWGTGSPRREFLYADDCADACVFLMNTYSGSDFVNIGTGEDLTIRELTEMVALTVGYKGEIHWDHTKPDGTPPQAPRRLAPARARLALQALDARGGAEGIRRFSPKGDRLFR